MYAQKVRRSILKKLCNGEIRGAAATRVQKRESRDQSGFRENARTQDGDGKKFEKLLRRIMHMSSTGNARRESGSFLRGPYSVFTQGCGCYYEWDNSASPHSSVAQWQSIRLLTGGL